MNVRRGINFKVSQKSKIDDAIIAEHNQMDKRFVLDKL